MTFGDLETPFVSLSLAVPLIAQPFAFEPRNRQKKPNSLVAFFLGLGGMLFSIDYSLIGPQAGLSVSVVRPKENGPTVRGETL